MKFWLVQSSRYRSYKVPNLFWRSGLSTARNVLAVKKILSLVSPLSAITCLIWPYYTWSVFSSDSRIEVMPQLQLQVFIASCNNLASVFQNALQPSLWGWMKQEEMVMPSFGINCPSVSCTSMCLPYTSHFFHPEAGKCNIYWNVTWNLTHSCLQIFAVKVQCIMAAFRNMSCKVLKAFQCYQPLSWIMQLPKHLLPFFLLLMWLPSIGWYPSFHFIQS